MSDLLSGVFEEEGPALTVVERADEEWLELDSRPSSTVWKPA